jgi:hypothetical protein
MPSRSIPARRLCSDHCCSRCLLSWRPGRERRPGRRIRRAGRSANGRGTYDDEREDMRPHANGPGARERRGGPLRDEAQDVATRCEPHSKHTERTGPRGGHMGSVTGSADLDFRHERPTRTPPLRRHQAHPLGSHDARHARIDPRSWRWRSGGQRERAERREEDGCAGDPCWAGAARVTLSAWRPHCRRLKPHRTTSPTRGRGCSAERGNCPAGPPGYPQLRTAPRAASAGSWR